MESNGVLGREFLERGIWNGDFWNAYFCLGFCGGFLVLFNFCMVCDVFGVCYCGKCNKNLMDDFTGSEVSHHLINS